MKRVGKNPGPLSLRSFPGSARTSRRCQVPRTLLDQFPNVFLSRSSQSRHCQGGHQMHILRIRQRSGRPGALCRAPLPHHVLHACLRALVVGLDPQARSGTQEAQEPGPRPRAILLPVQAQRRPRGRHRPLDVRRHLAQGSGAGRQVGGLYPATSARPRRLRSRTPKRYIPWMPSRPSGSWRRPAATASRPSTCLPSLRA
jgi:hypothetical protein